MSMKAVVMFSCCNLDWSMPNENDLLKIQNNFLLTFTCSKQLWKNQTNV